METKLNLHLNSLKLQILQEKRIENLKYGPIIIDHQLKKNILKSLGFEVLGEVNSTEIKSDQLDIFKSLTNEEILSAPTFLFEFFLIGEEKTVEKLQNKFELISEIEKSGTSIEPTIEYINNIFCRYLVEIDWEHDFISSCKNKFHFYEFCKSTVQKIRQMKFKQKEIDGLLKIESSELHNFIKSSWSNFKKCLIFEFLSESWPKVFKKTSNRNIDFANRIDSENIDPDLFKFEFILPTNNEEFRFKLKEIQWLKYSFVEVLEIIAKYCQSFNEEIVDQLLSKEPWFEIAAETTNPISLFLDLKIEMIENDINFNKNVIGQETDIIAKEIYRKIKVNIFCLNKLRKEGRKIKMINTTTYRIAKSILGNDTIISSDSDSDEMIYIPKKQKIDKIARKENPYKSRRYL